MTISPTPMVSYINSCGICDMCLTCDMPVARYVDFANEKEVEI